MSQFLKALNTTIIYGKRYPVRSNKRLAEEYCLIMNMKSSKNSITQTRLLTRANHPYLTAGGGHKPFDNNDKVQSNTNAIQSPRLNITDHPYLTAGGRHVPTNNKKNLSDKEIYKLMDDMKNHLDNHYLNWKKTK